jgi:hypothetical protein
MSNQTYLRRSVVAASLVFLAACSPSGEAADAAEMPSSTGAVPPAVAPSPAPSTLTLAVGTVLDATLSDSIHSRVVRIGDVFTARVVDDVLGADSAVAIPSGSVVEGSIAAMSPSQNERSTGTLTLVVSRVSVRGMSYPLAASIDSIGTTQEGVGAARVTGGSVLGRVIGEDARGTIVGGEAGGVAGDAVSVVMKDMDVVLPAGSHLMLTVRELLTVGVSTN